MRDDEDLRLGSHRVGEMKGPGRRLCEERERLVHRFLAQVTGKMLGS